MSSWRSQPRASGNVRRDLRSLPVELVNGISIRNGGPGLRREEAEQRLVVGVRRRRVAG